MTAINYNSTAAIADEFGALDAQIKALEERKAELRKELEARLAITPRVAGNHWTVTRADVVSSRLDTKGLKALLGDALDPYYVQSTAVRITVKPTVAIELVA